MDERPGDIPTIEELAVYLKDPKLTFYRLASEGKIPCRKIDYPWRFR